MEIERGEGMYLHTRSGKRYLDMFAGVAVNALGYGHPGLLRAIREQAERYIHVSNYYAQETQVQLAELLVRHTGFPRIFFANTGTETVEGAIKIARKWGSTRGKTELLSLAGAFHGRTLGALSLMDRDAYRVGFGPFLDSCRVIHQNDADALRGAVSKDTAALVMEFIQGEGGIRPVTEEFVALLCRLKKEHGFLLIADEIQSGLGRTGKMFAFQHHSVQPDLVLVAKPLGGGLPLGAILASEEAAETLQPGNHGTTFGGNPVACAAGCVVMQAITEGGLMENARRMGELLKQELEALAGAFPGRVKEIRGTGLMLGMELRSQADPIVASMREKGILINATDGTVLRFVPPLIVKEEQIRETIGALRRSLEEAA
jgi:predicted acetylornithine/succinylornithine family transaminase